MPYTYLRVRLSVLWLCILIATGLSACAVNPVTGKKELAFVPQTQEINMGTEQYGPGRQMQGGDYSVHPQVTAYVNEVGRRLAAVSDRNLPYEFTVLNNATPNAWALPGGKIAVNRGLLTELNSEAELAAVLGHEIVHAAARHGAKNVERGMLLQGALLAATAATSNSEYAGMVVGGAGMASQLITQKYSRNAELEADYYGMHYMARAGYDPLAAVELQKTFVRLASGHEQSWIEGLFASHPPSVERIEANQRTAAELKHGGERGAERYAAAMAPLRRDLPAYEKYAAGKQALEKGELDNALQLAEAAIALQPEEPLFHGLRGDIRLQQQRYDDAITNYDRALALDNQYFHYYLQRGLAHKEQGELQQAEADLSKSAEYLPTAPALNGMGQLALFQGDNTAAKKFFAAASSSDSPAGHAAKSALVRLDLKDNPQEYIRLGGGLDAQGYLTLQLSNTTAEAISNIEIHLRYADAHANKRTGTVMYKQILEPKQTLRLRTEIGPLENLRQVSARITKAQLVSRAVDSMH